jgi:hypothetical protein
MPQDDRVWKEDCVRIQRVQNAHVVGPFATTEHTNAAVETSCKKGSFTHGGTYFKGPLEQKQPKRTSGESHSTTTSNQAYGWSKERVERTAHHGLKKTSY